MEAFQLDVADRDAVFALAATVEKQFGPADLVLNNAGVALGAPVAEITMDNFKWLMDINFWGVVHGTQAFLPAMIAQAGSGHIANVSSIFGLIGVPTQSAYNAAKFGVLGFTEALRHEVKERRHWRLDHSSRRHQHQYCPPCALPTRTGNGERTRRSD